MRGRAVQYAIDDHLDDCLGLISSEEKERLGKILETGYAVIEMVQSLKAAGCERLEGSQKRAGIPDSEFEALVFFFIRPKLVGTREFMEMVRQG
jgi:hypothetical protein